MRYDLVVIGGGPAGEKAAAAAAYFGKTVALIDRGVHGPGGAAVHTGTIPSKTLRETALYITGFHRRQLYGGLSFEPDTKARSAPELTCRLPGVRETQTKQIRANLERHGIREITGVARLEAADRVRVGDEVLEADNVLIATGSQPRRPPEFDFDDPQVYDSDTLLEIDRIPDSLAVIGGGVIGSEYACVFAALGVKIEVIEQRDRLLGFLDHEISDALMASMRASGIEIHLDDGVERLERVGDKLRLTLTSGDVETVDRVLVCAGRTGNTAGLGLEAIGVELDDRKQIVVDPQFRTSIPTVYAAGDVIGFPALASTSMEQGRMAVAAMFDDVEVPLRDWEAIPAGIYTIPEACACGPSEQELQKQGVPYVVGRSHMRHNARGQIIGDTDGFVKLIFHRETRELLATHMICEWATELIHTGQAVMRLGGGIDYFLASVLTFPSLSEAYKLAAYDAAQELLGKHPPPLA
jgi:NAD(P) transhydrogenase